MYKVTRRLWLTADSEHVVDDGDERAAFLLAAPGDELPDAVARRYGLTAPARTASDNPLDRFTVAQLRELAATSGVALPDGARKADIVAALTAALPAGGAGTGTPDDTPDTTSATPEGARA